MRSSSTNVGDVERLSSAVAGAFLTLSGLRHRGGAGKLMLGAGASLLYRGLTGSCPAYRTLGLSSAHSLSLPRRYMAESTIAVLHPPRDLLTLARENMSRVLATSDAVSTSDGSSGNDFAFECARMRGTVRVWQEPKSELSLLRLTIDVDAGNGLLEKPAHVALRPFARHYFKEALRKFKMWVETGEVATTTGQPHGKRSRKGQLILDAFESMKSRTGGVATPQLEAPDSLLSAGDTTL